MFKIFVLFVLYSIINAQEWNYADKGEDYWPTVFPKCGGKFQSPVNILRYAASYNENLKPIVAENVDLPLFFKVENTGATLLYTPLASQPRVVFGGSNFKKAYTLVQFHLHWGQNNYQGSEHYIDGNKFPAEIHFVAQTDDGELAVFAFLYKLSNETNPKLNTLIESVSEMSAINGDSKVHSLSLENLIPDDANLWSQYYRYVGSLTQPPCTEGVTWTVFRAMIPISVEQLQSFRMNEIKINFRQPPQKFRKRVLKSFIDNKNGLVSARAFAVARKLLKNRLKHAE